MAFTNLFNANDEPALLKSIYDNHKVAVYTDDNQSAELEMTFEGVTSGGITQTSGQFASSFGYDDNYSKRLFYLGKIKKWNSGDTGALTLRFSDIDFSNNPFRVIAGGQGSQSGDTLEDRAKVLVWKPDIGFRKLKAFRCDSEGIPSMTANYIKVSGIIQFSLVNNESAVNIGADSTMAADFLPVGKFKLTITDGTTSIPGEDNIVTNQGTEISVRDALNGIQIDEIFNCSGLNIDNASCLITASVLDEVGGNDLYSIYPLQVVVSGGYFFHLAPDGSGLGIGGPPMHGRAREPALDINLPTYLERLICAGVDMVLNKESVAVWAEKLGSNVTLGQMLDYLLNRQKSVMTVFKQTDQTLSTTMSKVNMDSISSFFGDGLEAYNGGIRIKEGSGIRAVMVGGSIGIGSGLSSGDIVVGRIMKNSTNMMTATYFRAANTMGNLIISPIPMGVNEGDVIYIYAQNQTASRGGFSNYAVNRLTVQEM